MTTEPHSFAWERLIEAYERAFLFGPEDAEEVKIDNEYFPILWWCNTHRREATHIHRKTYGDTVEIRHCCDPKLGGIMIPCLCVDLTGIAEITKTDSDLPRAAKADPDFFATNCVPWRDPMDGRPFAIRFLDAIYESKRRGIDGKSIKRKRAAKVEPERRPLSESPTGFPQVTTTTVFEADGTQSSQHSVTYGVPPPEQP